MHTDKLKASQEGDVLSAAEEAWAETWRQFGRPRFGSELFTVKHFAGEIVYDPAGGW